MEQIHRMVVRGMLLRVYFNDFSQRSYITGLIENSRRVNLKSGVTAFDEGEGNWGINVNKIEIR